VMNSDEQTLCIDFGGSEKCSFYTTLKGCSLSKEGKCSWIKAEDRFTCVAEKLANFCEFYIHENGCSESISHELCVCNFGDKEMFRWYQVLPKFLFYKSMCHCK
jgi:hypothetical protein